ncbi:aminotransferase class IV [Salinibacterium sp. ZJ70]|uniref:aminotransferase class IV n=1 Tax=Salinibacterium sp. ZJ70 TaxID=2708084 RepID=UPI0014201608|nr:aminotransferase class IV [Salinibacterium sp. ZJ70]
MRALALIEFDEEHAVASGHRMADPDIPHLRVTDLAATRGDGVFETAMLVEGSVHALDAHLERLAQSAHALDLATGSSDIWRAAVLAVADALTRGGVLTGSLKLVLSRGVEGSRVPTGWVYGSPAPDAARVRADGVRIALLDRGYRHDVSVTSPWLLTGAKTLSAAVHRAAQREAVRRGADDAVFVSSDGFLLEGASSSLLLLRGTHFVTPSVELGILAGTTQADLFAWAEQSGFTTGYELLTPEDLAAADAAWLVSSVRGAVPIRAVDGVERSIDGVLTASLDAALRARAT